MEADLELLAFSGQAKKSAMDSRRSKLSLEKGKRHAAHNFFFSFLFPVSAVLGDGHYYC